MWIYQKKYISGDCNSGPLPHKMICQVLTAKCAGIWRHQDWKGIAFLLINAWFTDKHFITHLSHTTPYRGRGFLLGDSRTVRDPEKCKGGLALGSDCANFNSFRGSRNSYQSIMIYIFMLILLINIAWGIVSLHYFFRVNAKGMGQVANTETSLSHTEYKINNAAFVRE